MGTVAEILGIEPEVLWMPELDELNSVRGRIAIAQVARAELLGLFGSRSTLTENGEETINFDCVDLPEGIDGKHWFCVVVSALSASALNRVIKKPIAFTYNTATSTVDSNGRLTMDAAIDIAIQAVVKDCARAMADAIVTKSRSLLSNGYLIVYGCDRQITRVDEPDGTPVKEVLERVVDVLEAVTQPRVTEIERDEAGLIASVTSR